MRIWFLFLASFGWTSFEVQGVLENGSSDSPGHADVVNLIHLQQGMQVSASLADVSGSFKFSVNETFQPGTFLVQAYKDGIVYTARLTTLAEPVKLLVFDKVEAGDIGVRIGSLAVYGYEQNVDIGLFYNLDNAMEPPKVYAPKGPSFAFSLIEGYRDVEATTQRGSMPLRQDLEIKEGRAFLNYALKPGRTQLRVRSSHGYNPNEANFYTIPLPEDQDNLHLLLLPSTMKLEGEGLEFVSKDPKNDVNLYEWERVEGQTTLRIQVSGQPDPERGDSAHSEDDGHDHGESASAPKIERLPNVIHPFRWFIIGGALLLLSLGSIYGFRRA